MPQDSHNKAPPLRQPPPKKFYGTQPEHPNLPTWEEVVQNVMDRFKVTREQAQKMLDEAV